MTETDGTEDDFTTLSDPRNPLPQVLGTLDGREIRPYEDLGDISPVVSVSEEPNPWYEGGTPDRTLVTEPRGELAERIRKRLALPSDAPVRLIEFVHWHYYSEYTSEDDGTLWVESRGLAYPIGEEGSTWPPSVVKLMTWLDEDGS